MTWSKEFVELDKSSHDRESFDCSKEELNTFIRTQAAKHMEARISRTFVLPASAPLINGKYPITAFYTITPGTIKREELPDTIAKKLPHYPVPVFLLAQMAVNNGYRGNGLGRATLIRALNTFVDINKEMPAFAVIVDCLDDGAKSFYEKYDFKVLCEHNGKTRMFIPMKTLEQLF